MTNDRFEQFLRESARDYNEPPDTPREEMWQRIRAARTAGPNMPRRGWSIRWTTWAAAAAVLAVGIGIGRVSVRPEPGQPLASAAIEADDSEDQMTVYRVAASDLLGRADAFLSMFRAEAPAGRADDEIGSWARDLLGSMRLMMDSPAGDDPALRALFEDLEAVLAQIAQYTVQRDQTELDLIEEGIDESGLMLRLRSAADYDAVPIQGVI